MRLVLAALAALAAAAPAQAAPGLTRAKAERLVERKARAVHGERGDRVAADCARRSRRAFACTWVVTRAHGIRFEGCTPRTSGKATVSRRAGHNPRVRLVGSPVGETCDDRG